MTSFYYMYIIPSHSIATCLMLLEGEAFLFSLDLALHVINNATHVHCQLTTYQSRYRFSLYTGSYVPGRDSS